MFRVKRGVIRHTDKFESPLLNQIVSNQMKALIHLAYKKRNKVGFMVKKSSIVFDIEVNMMMMIVRVFCGGGQIIIV